MGPDLFSNGVLVVRAKHLRIDVEARLYRIVYAIEIGVAVIGVAFTSTLSIERDVALGPTDSVNVQGYDFTVY